ncbi:MAG: hypothetical protein JSU04_04125 [Bdellovibrionales bacterium]|nr:hypothetical protein [Bdellovibrionales bacterium]
MITLLLMTGLMGPMVFAADNPPSGPSAPTHSAGMPGSAQAQLDMMKKDVMDKCMAVKKNEGTCKDMMKSCGDTKLQSCMNEKLNMMKK